MYNSNNADQLNEKFLCLLNTSRTLISTVDINELLFIIMEFARKIVNAEASSLLLIDENTKELYFDVAIGTAANKVKRIRLKSGEGIAGWCAMHSSHLIVEDVTKDARWSDRVDDNSDFKTKSIICVPMQYKNKILGVIEGINAVGREFFTKDDLSFFEIFASQAAGALENARLFSELIQEKEKILATYNGMNEAVFVTDKNGVIIQSNKSASNLVNSKNTTGFLFSKILTDFDFEIPPNLLKFNGKTKTFEIVKRIDENSQPLNKQILSCVITKITDGDNNGDISSYIFVIRDVTSEKKEEFMKRTFLSLISHKLKTPLVSIVGYLSILAESKLATNQQKAISVLQSQSERLVKLVEDLLKFTVIESKTFELKRENILIEKIVFEALTDLNKKLKDVDIEVSDLSSICEIYVDKEKIKEVLMCILENAIKFNKKKSKKLVKITGDFKSNFVFINIEDNGDGLSLFEQEKIFEEFYQVEESFTGQVEGVGLGLPLAKRIIFAHGGNISVTSEINVGSKFTIKIPIR
ncbi:MAG: ATP-binding protein [Elusimicrobiota bacterium]